jgi:hypothetical protein
MSKTKEITIHRLHKYEHTVIGKLYVDNEYFCWTLEDIPRKEKVYGETCIPENYTNGVKYNLRIVNSPTFGKDTINIYTSIEKGIPYVRNEGLSFTYILFHGGNTHKDTHGCVLVAKNRPTDNTIQGAMHKELGEIVKKWIKKGFEVDLTIKDLTESHEEKEKQI